MLVNETSNPSGPPGSAAASYAYGPYGERDEDISKLDDSTTNPVNPYRYSGRRFDSGSETYDMGPRRFESGAMRFLQQDFLTSALGDLSLSLDPLTQNRFSLAGGNPVSYVEWDGHMPAADSHGAAHNAEDSPKAGRSDGSGTIRVGGARPSDPNDYTLAQFEQMTTEERSAWLREFQRKYGTQEWFNAQLGVLRAFEDLGIGKPGSWASVVDASILHSIQSGMALYEGREPLGRHAGDRGWEAFFRTLFSGRATPDEELKDVWSSAEEAATGTGVRRAERLGVIRTIGEHGILEGAEDFRSAVKTRFLEPVQDAAIDYGNVLTEVGCRMFSSYTGGCDPRNEQAAYHGTMTTYAIYTQYGDFTCAGC